MCLAVWIGTARPVTPLAPPRDANVRLGSFPIEAVPGDAPIRGRFASPCVTYVGAHEGCGCGFNSEIMLECEGIAEMTEAMSLVEALDDVTRAEFLAEQHSREWLHALVVRALADGDVEVYGCWFDDEHLPVARVESVDARWLTERLVPLEEQVKYVLHGAHDAGRGQPSP
jgi:hypothetical protein